MTTHRYQILRQLADGRFHSGAKLARSLDVSRTAIWKNIATIKQDMGLDVFSVRGKGYRLPQPLELLEPETILGGLGAAAGGLVSRLEVHEQIDSTNSHLTRKLAEGIERGHVCLAEQQTAGRGRRGRSWVSPFGSNIYLSIYWRYTLALADLGGLSLAALP